jgi:hypothetical protein
MTTQEARRRRKAEIAMRALVKYGTPKIGAAHLGISDGHFRRLVAEYCAEHGHETPVEAAYWLDREQNVHGST